MYSSIIKVFAVCFTTEELNINGNEYVCAIKYIIRLFYIPLYDKRVYFNSHITNFPFLSSNIQSSPAYGVFISQLIRDARACSSYECFILRAVRLSNKLLGQGYVKGLER